MKKDFISFQIAYGSGSFAFGDAIIPSKGIDFDYWRRYIKSQTKDSTNVIILFFKEI